MIRRRDFVALAAAAPAMGASLAAVPSRKIGKVETVFKSPGADPKPNGLQATKEGLWIMDQGEGNRAYLVTYEGKLIRGFETGADRASGITFDGEALWIGSTYNRLSVRADAMTGKTLEEHPTPGAGVIYRMLGDPPQRSSPLAPRRAAPPERKQPRPPAERPDPARQLGTGAHGQEWRDGKLWMSVPPSRMIYRVDPKTWIVEQRFPAAANRPHGLGWEGRYLWCADTNLNGFYKHDTETGQIVEKIQLAETDPAPHGATIWQGMMWYCDDVGIVCRFKL